MNVLEHFVSVAQNYVRAAPIVFDRANGAELFDETGNRYIDFHCAGGALGYGHNNAKVRNALIEYLTNEGVLQTCDRASVAKKRFVETFVSSILQPRHLNYRILFTDPASGASADVAFRLARRHTNRSQIIAFTNSSHGPVEGSLSATSKHPTRYEAPTFRGQAVFMPFSGYFGQDVNTIAYLRRYLEDTTSGLERPAAVIVETVQVHGGVHVASDAWLKALEELCREFAILLIVDETQTGCRRTGPYFSFERAGIKPDIVLVSNAIAGGLPISLLLLRPELDHWRPGEGVGIFQGDSLSFVAATELIAQWTDSSTERIAELGKLIEDKLSKLIAHFPRRRVRLCGRGLIWGLDLGKAGSAAVVSAWALERGLIVEPARVREEVLLVLPPITIEEALLREGLDRLTQALEMFLSHG